MTTPDQRAALAQELERLLDAEFWPYASAGTWLYENCDAILAALRSTAAAQTSDANLRMAALTLYANGRWSCNLPEQTQRFMWERLRDALGLTSPGSEAQARAAIAAIAASGGA